MTSDEANRSFAELLATFSAAVVANDGAGLAALFTADGIYADEFFGVHRGRSAIAAMLQRFHDTGRDYRWNFIDPVSDGTTGYARFRFSFAVGAVVATVILQLAVVYVPFLQRIFTTRSLGVWDLAVAFALSSSIFVAVEGAKWWRRRRDGHTDY